MCEEKSNAFSPQPRPLPACEGAKGLAIGNKNNISFTPWKLQFKAPEKIVARYEHFQEIG